MEVQAYFGYQVREKGLKGHAVHIFGTAGHTATPNEVPMVYPRLVPRVGTAGCQGFRYRLSESYHQGQWHATLRCCIVTDPLLKYALRGRKVTAGGVSIKLH